VLLKKVVKKEIKIRKNKNKKLVYMSLLKYINIPIFILSLAIGIFFVYIYQIDKRVIYVYPKPDNVDYIQYKDATGTCFNVKQDNIKCPKDSEISKIPAQG